MKKVYLIYSTFSNKEKALKVGRTLVNEKLAACVNIIPKVNSVYRWKGKVEEAEEALMLAKTTEEKVREVIERIKELHEYELPAIVAIEVKEGLREFVSYVNESCT
ncbi:MAG: divalent-cation tolerance protein CutA [Thermoplasmata archaeon]|nr:divalent-cation tolerance protein CutA [Thermoplasmata archaeon]